MYIIICIGFKPRSYRCAVLLQTYIAEIDMIFTIGARALRNPYYMGSKFTKRSTVISLTRFCWKMMLKLIASSSKSISKAEKRGTFAAAVVLVGLKWNFVFEPLFALFVFLSI